MRTHINLILAAYALLLTAGLFAQPEIEWENSYGGSEGERAECVKQTLDGGFVIAGRTSSFDGDITDTLGMNDCWIVKTTALGELEWQISLGGSDDDHAYSIDPTSEGGYIVAGYSRSTDGQVTGNHGDRDIWVVKLSNNGLLEWQKSYGGSSSDQAYSVHQTSDFGYIVAGQTASTDGDVASNEETSQYWIVKLDSLGTLEWENSLGGSSSERAYSVQETSDGNYIVAGRSHSTDGDVTDHHGLFNGDFWIVKLDNLGELIWEKSLGGTDQDWAYAIDETESGGIIATGWTFSSDGDVTDFKGERDIWVVKLSSDGDLIWERTLGGSSQDFGYSITSTSDDGCAVLGWTGSSDIDVSNFYGGLDYWIVKLSTTGNILWEKSLGGSDGDIPKHVEQTDDGGFILCGYSESQDGDVNTNNGSTEYWVVKLSPEAVGLNDFESNQLFSVSPNPTHDYLVLTSDNESLKGNYAITDAQGKIKLNGMLFGASQNIDVRNLAPGVYSLILSVRGKVNHLNFVKQ